MRSNRLMDDDEEQRPLDGRCVAVLRAEHQAEESKAALEEKGATVLCEPVFDMLPPVDWGPVDQAIDNISECDWLIFSSRNGVEFFLQRMSERTGHWSAIQSIKMAAIGPVTAEVLRSLGCNPEVVPDDFSSEELSSVLFRHVTGKRVLLVRADRGRDHLAEQLTKVCKSVGNLTVYRQVARLIPSRPFLEALKGGKIDWVMISSGNMARGFAGWLDEEAAAIVRKLVSIVAISPRTAQVIRDLGFEPRAVASIFTYEGMMEAMLREEGVDE